MFLFFVINGVRRGSDVITVAMEMDSIRRAADREITQQLSVTVGQLLNERSTCVLYRTALDGDRSEL
jgi:hypothetical protein